MHLRLVHLPLGAASAALLLLVATPGCNCGDPASSVPDGAAGVSADGGTDGGDGLNGGESTGGLDAGPGDGGEVTDAGSGDGGPGGADGGDAGTAAPLAYEGFDYAVGATLLGRDGGSGWRGPWVVTVQGPSTVASAAQSGTIVEGLAYADDAGRALRVTGGAWQTDATLFFGQAQRATEATFGAGGTTRWISFLVRQASATTGTNYAGPTIGTGYTYGAAATWCGLAAGVVGCNAFYAQSGGVSAPLAGWGAGVVTLLLMAVDFDTDAGAADTVSLWANPPLGTELGPPAVSARFADFAQALGGLTIAWGDNRSFTIDEVRVGESVEAVTPYLPP